MAHPEPRGNLTPRASLTPREDNPEASEPEKLRHPLHLPALCLLVLYGIVASWLFGGITLWTRYVLFGLGALPLFLLLLPVPQRSLRRSAWQNCAATLRGLLLFPPFWFGLALFAYVILQWNNPSWTFIEIGGKWWISNAALDPKPDWPTSIYAPATRGNPGSFLLRFAGVWMVVCAAWLLLRRRKDILTLLIALSVNSFLLALVSLIQEIQQPDKVLWLYPWKGSDFSGPFFYRNHGGAFFYLLMAINFALALYFQRNRDPHRPTGGRAALFFLIGLVNAGAVAASGSRAGWIFGCALLLLYLFFCLILFLRGRQWRGSWIGGLTVLGCTVILIGSIAASQNVDYLQKHFERFLRIPNELERSGRTIGNEASWDMLEDVFVFGYGADSYGHAFALYAKDYPQLMRHHRRSGRTRTNWVQAHHDPLQMAVELGVVGASILALSPLFFLALYVCRIFRFREENLLLLAAVSFLFAHTFVDLIFQSVSILAVVSLLMVVIARLLGTEKSVLSP